MVCRHFGHGNESGRDRLPPVSISVHRKELLHIGHRGTSGRNSIATGQTIHSSTSTTKIGHAISGAGNAKAIATCQPLMRQTLHHKTIAFCGNWMASPSSLGPGKRRNRTKGIVSKPHGPTYRALARLVRTGSQGTTEFRELGQDVCLGPASD